MPSAVFGRVDGRSTTSVAATATAAAAATTVTATTTAAFATGFLRTGFVDLEGSAIQFVAIEGVDRLVRAFRITVSDEGEAAGALGHAVEGDEYIGDLTVLGEQILKIGLGGCVGKVSHVQFGTHGDF